MLFSLDGIAHPPLRPDHIGPFPPRRVRRHVGQAIVRGSTVASKSRQVDLLSINSSTAQDKRSGHPAFLPLHVCPSHFKPLSSVPRFLSSTKLSPTYRRFRYIQFPLLPLPLPLNPTIDSPPLAFASRPVSTTGTGVILGGLMGGWGARNWVPAVPMV